MNTAATQTLMSGPDMVDCLSIDLSGSSQEVPFYAWAKTTGAPKGFGGEPRTTGKVQGTDHIEVYQLHLE